VLLLLERVDLWLWRSISLRVSWWHPLPVLDMPIRRSLSFKDVMIQAYELRAAKNHRGHVFVRVRDRFRTLSIDACTLRRSHGVSLGPWNYEARVRFY